MGLLAWIRGRLHIEPSEETLDKEEPMHFAPPPEHLPLCGKVFVKRWTEAFAKDVTCTECRRLGLALVVQYQASNR